MSGEVAGEPNGVCEDALDVLRKAAELARAVCEIVEPALDLVSGALFGPVLID